MATSEFVYPCRILSGLRSKMTRMDRPRRGGPGRGGWHFFEGSTTLAGSGHIVERILVLRGKRVLIDADLASLYGVSTKRLNEQIKRNRDRFPSDFMFELTQQEKTEVVATCDHLARLRFSPTLPRAFTEHGAIMAASVLNTPLAIAVSIHVVRAFVAVREALVYHRDLSRRLADLESKCDAKFRIVFDAIRRLMTPPDKPKRRIGFGAGEP